MAHTEQRRRNSQPVPNHKAQRKGLSTGCTGRQCRNEPPGATNRQLNHGLRGLGLSHCRATNEPMHPHKHTLCRLTCMMHASSQATMPPAAVTQR